MKPLKFLLIAIVLFGTFELYVACKKDAVAAVKPVTITIVGPANAAGMYKLSNPITCQSNTVYQWIEIDLGTTGSRAFNISGKTNVTLKHCKITGGVSYSVWAGNKSSNIKVDSCFFSSVAAGPYAENSAGIQFTNNQVLNVNGNKSLWTFGHGFQFVNVSGTGNKINYNREDNIAGVAVNPHDHISVYKCFPADTIQVIGNQLRGGQRALQPGGGGGACGITITDVTGNLQVVRGNTLVNTGYAGIQCIGSGTNVKIDHNKVYSSATPISLLGFSIQDRTQIYCGYNRTNWTNSKGVTKIFWQGNPQYWLSSSPIPVGFSTNTWNDAGITAAILPAQIITMQ